MASFRFRIRSLLIVVIYLAVDLAAFTRMITAGSFPWLLVFLVLTLFAPIFAVLCAGFWWLVKHIDWSGKTLY